MKKGKIMVVQHPPKLPNASGIEKALLGSIETPKPILNVDKKPLG